jgi:ferredoxin-NADP reductase
MTITATAGAAAGRTGAAALELLVTEAVDEAPGIRSLVLRAPDGARLPSYVPGSHIIIRCGGRSNAYSLTGTGEDPREYPVSVLQVASGNGGSAAIHRLAVGDRVTVSRPRSAFAPVATARRHLLVAGGIGITPMLSHLRAGRRWGRPVELLYSYRPGRGAHLQALRALAGKSLAEFTGRTEFQAALARRLRRQPLGTHLYVCGPQGFTDLVLAEARAAGWPGHRLHAEAFGAAALDPGRPFTATLARSGRILGVPAGTSLLEALEGAGIPVPNLCRQGVCGECRLPVRRGIPEHRDLYLGAGEKSANDSIMCCVSRSLDPELELDL